MMLFNFKKAAEVKDINLYLYSESTHLLQLNQCKKEFEFVAYFSLFLVSGVIKVAIKKCNNK